MSVDGVIVCSLLIYIEAHVDPSLNALLAYVENILEDCVPCIHCLLPNL